MTAPRVLEVTIQGDDELSGTLRVSKEQLRGFVADVKAQMGDSGAAVVVLAEREKELARSFVLGARDAGQQAAALKTLKADISELANTTKLGVREQEQLARVARSVDASLVGMSRAEIRSVDAAEALQGSVAGLNGALQGNVGSLTMVTSSMQRFAIGAPKVVAALGTIGAAVGIAAVIWTTLRDRAREAEEAQIRASEAATTAIGGVTLQGKDRVTALQGMIGSARGELTGITDVAVPAAITEMRSAGGVDVPTIANQAAITEAANINRMNEARRRAIELRIQQAELDIAKTQRAMARDRGGRGGSEREEPDSFRDLTIPELLEMGGVGPALAELQNLAPVMSTASERGLADLRADESGMFVNTIKTQLEELKLALGETRGEMRLFGEDTKGTREEWDALAGSIAAQLESGAIQGLTQLLDFSGGGLKKFGAIVGDVIGGALITMGQGAIGIGLASEAIKKALSNILNGGGAGAIIVGGAVIALGHLVRRVAGATSSQLSAGFGGAGGGSGSGGYGGGGDFAGIGRGGPVTIELPANGFILDPHDSRTMDWFERTWEQFTGRDVEIIVSSR